MLHISEFSGQGGFDLASDWMGWKNIVSCEISKFCRQVLQYYWPDAYHHDDIVTLTYKIIDEECKKRFGQNWRSDNIVLSGGFPCQPYSVGGHQEGDQDERHLWPEMLRTIREISPRWVVGENVRGLINWNKGLVFHQIQADLEAEGYEVTPFLLPAVGVNAIHERYRVWFVAYNKSVGVEGNRSPGLSQSRLSFRETVLGCDHAGAGWRDWSAESPLLSGDYGLPFELVGITVSKWKLESLKAIGNSVVPQLVLQIFKAIEQYEKLYNSEKNRN